MIPGSKNGHPSVKKSFLFAIQGLRGAFATERNIKIMAAAGICAIVAGIVLRLDLISWALIVLCVGMVLSAELLNTAIETAMDLVSPEFHPFAGRAKDIAAAAVWVLSIAAALIGILVYANAILKLGII